MSFSPVVKEKIARIIGSFFTTNQIVSVFDDVNVPTNRELFAKWRIILDAFNKMPDQEISIPHILSVFCHPLNFQESQYRSSFIEKLNTALAYENLEIRATERSAKVFSNGALINFSQSSIGPTKTAIDYVTEAVTFFKNEYNKVRMSGLTYEYSLGENIDSHATEDGREGYDERLKAIEQLKSAGFITEYTIEARAENDLWGWDYAICKIDESKITQKEAPPATEAGVQNLIQKIEITAMPEVPVRFMGDNTPTKSKKRESPIELSLPELVRWDKVTLKIKEGRQEVEIFYDNNHIITADYRQLRFFVGEKQQKPDRQWGFLCALSTLAATDIKQATAENMRSMIMKNKTLSINSVHQTKKLFVERLQEIFKTHDDPFHDRREYYEPKFKILPEPALRREKLWPQGGPLNENRGDETDRLAYEGKRTQEESEEEAL